MKTFRETERYLLKFSDLRKMKYQIGGADSGGSGDGAGAGPGAATTSPAAAAAVGDAVGVGCLYKINTEGMAIIMKHKEDDDLEDPWGWNDDDQPNLYNTGDKDEIKYRQLLYIIKLAYEDKRLKAVMRLPRNLKLNDFGFSEAMLREWLKKDKNYYTEVSVWGVGFYEELQEYIPIFLQNYCEISSGGGGVCTGAGA